MKKTCTPYTGSLSSGQQARVLALLWPYLKHVPGVDQVETGEGTKTQTGLLLTLEDIIVPTSQYAADPEEVVHLCQND